MALHWYSSSWLSQSLPAVYDPCSKSDSNHPIRMCQLFPPGFALGLPLSSPHPCLNALALCPQLPRQGFLSYALLSSVLSTSHRLSTPEAMPLLLAPTSYVAGTLRLPASPLLSVVSLLCMSLGCRGHPGLSLILFTTVLGELRPLFQCQYPSAPPHTGAPRWAIIICNPLDASRSLPHMPSPQVIF